MQNHCPKVTSVKPAVSSDTSECSIQLVPGNATQEAAPPRFLQWCECCLPLRVGLSTRFHKELTPGQEGAERAAAFLHPLSSLQLFLTDRFFRYQHKSVLNAHLRLYLNRNERVAICPDFILREADVAGCKNQCFSSTRFPALAQTQAAGLCYLCHQQKLTEILLQSYPHMHHC